jgi:hypothetical protein
MRTKILISGIVGLCAVLGLFGGAWYLLHERQAKICPFSGREIHPETRALVTIGGKKFETCCVRCAIIEAQQTGKPLRVLKVADFETSKLMDPGDAWFVEGSAVNMCMRMSSAAESQGRESVYVRAFDRCSPSALAFSNEQHARDFVARHGGALKRLADLESEVTSNTGKVRKP